VVHEENDVSGLASTTRTQTQIRLLGTALDLFAEHGVGATSYQMIADRLGVTKAAIYHKFKTKEELVIAVAEMELAKLEDAIQQAEEENGSTHAREVLLARVVDHAVEHRRAAHILQFDPVVVRLLSRHRPFQLFLERLYSALAPGARDPATDVQVAMVLSTISGTVTHPLAANVDDHALRSQLRYRARLLLDLPEPARRRPSRVRRSQASSPTARRPSP
jgi:AcrR family transcriptional regulator